MKAKKVNLEHAKLRRVNMTYNKGGLVAVGAVEADAACQLREKLEGIMKLD